MRHRWANVIVAWLDGQDIQYKNINYNSPWIDFKCDHLSAFDDDQYQWRIKPIKKYRVALHASNDGTAWASTVNDHMAEQYDEKSKYFVKWLTDWIYYD